MKLGFSVAEKPFKFENGMILVSELGVASFDFKLGERYGLRGHPGIRPIPHLGLQTHRSSKGDESVQDD
jgi:hypothetical protein